MPVSVFAKIKAKPGKEDAVKQALLALIQPTRLEAGCINYDLHQSNTDKADFRFYENWESEEAFDQHLKTPHIQSFLEKADDLLSEPVEITLSTRIEK